MKQKQSIQSMIHEPMLAKVTFEVTTDEIDIAGEHDFQLIRAGEYQAFDIINAKLTNLSANNVVTYRASVLRNHFIKAQLTGLQLPDAHIKDVTFENCRINLSNFRKTAFKRCAFIQCDLREADFAEAQLTNVSFQNCELDDAMFSNMRCNRVEFEETYLGAIKGIYGLKNATITEQNILEIAPILANELGIKIA